MTTEKNWKELIETGKELHEKAKDRKRPGEMSLSDFMREEHLSKDYAQAVIKKLFFR